ncbi:flagellar biosynthesis protein FlgJ [Nitratireductor sp. CAU 1489]|uniref:Flagellar biosynthesis protein FlgJ n=1 Tax=Nitratireductor arenosus TaxID=2682096 RepID=A0A844Q915_9HYPH|nr:rod-binding protein [Nitratireductor arenosus]MVA95725.1 flagellar biosynthesis protein FlgJ [Nitratireductor arenosus]
MAISPPSDIVLDVARAVDKTDLAAARTRLAAAAKSVVAGFEAGGAQNLRGKPVDGTGAEAPEAFRDFEAMVLQTFMQSMLPADAQNVYGEGLAGEMWKTFLAQELSSEMAKRGGIGIADRVLGDFYMDDDKRVAVAGIASDMQAKRAADTQDLLSVALIDEIQRTIVRSFEDEADPTGLADRSGR